MKEKIFRYSSILFFTIVFTLGISSVIDVKAADYYIDTYSDGISVWVTDTDKIGTNGDKYIADVKFVYPKGNYDEEMLVFQQKSDGHWYYGYGNDSNLILVENDDASNDILYYVLNH